MNEKKPTLLRGLKIKSVSVVDQGANQHAHIQLAKRAEDEPEEKPVDTDKAFFERLGQAIVKMLHLPMRQGAVEKDAHTFAEVDGAREVNDQVWRIIDALGDSLRSIINDNDLSDAQKAEMIVTTADEVAASIKSDIAGMFSGAAVSKGTEEQTGNEGEGDKPQPDSPTTEQPQENPAENNIPNVQKGENLDMKFDTEKMTPEERATFEDLQKRFGVEEDNPEEQPAAENQPEQAQEETFKALHPAVAAELEELKKFKAQVEDREMMEVAKKYAIIGKKPEELAPVLKNLKAAGGSAFDDMIAVLDSTVEAVNKSGMFGEIGKRGSSSATEDAWGKIETAAQEIIKSKPGMRWADAVDAACLAHPELVEEYEKSR